MARGSANPDRHLAHFLGPSIFLARNVPEAGIRIFIFFFFFFFKFQLFFIRIYDSKLLQTHYDLARSGNFGMGLGGGGGGGGSAFFIKRNSDSC